MMEWRRKPTTIVAVYNLNAGMPLLGDVMCLLNAQEFGVGIDIIFFEQARLEVLKCWSCKRYLLIPTYMSLCLQDTKGGLSNEMYYLMQGNVIHPSSLRCIVQRVDYCKLPLAQHLLLDGYSSIEITISTLAVQFLPH